jgi:ACDE family multidrug resistance protein
MTATASNHREALWILSFIPIVMVLGNSMIIPVLPTISELYHVSDFQVSLLITLFSIPAAITIPLAGILADRVGRKKIILWGLVIYGTGGILSAIFAIWFKGSFWLLLASRIIQGIGAAGTAPIAMVLVSDLFQEEFRGKALGIIEAANAVGKVLSPILGSLLAMITWYAMFLAFPLLTIPLTLAMFKKIKVPQNKKSLSLQAYKKGIISIFKRHGRWLTVVFFAGFFVMFSLFGVLFSFSDYLETNRHMAGVIKGFILAIPLLGLSSSAYWTGSHIKQRTRQMKRLILTGLVGMTLIIALLFWIKQFYALLFLLLFLGICSGFILPCLNTLVTSSIGMEERGSITSFYSSIRFFGVALGPPIFGLLTARPVILYFGLAACLLIATLLVFFFVRHPQRLRGKGDRTRFLLHKQRLQTVK